LRYLDEPTASLNTLSPEDWKQIIAVQAVREAWGLEDDATPSDVAGTVYARSRSGAFLAYISGQPYGHPPCALWI